MLGIFDGESDARLDGLLLGIVDGTSDDMYEGTEDGKPLGSGNVGLLLGNSDGISDGIALG